MPLANLTADFEHAAVGTAPGGAYSGGSWQRVNANRTLIVSTPRRRGTRCCRIDLQAGDDPIGSTGIRCEWTDGRDPDETPTGVEGWYAVSLYFPDGTDPFGRGDPAWEGGSQWCTVFQLHHNGSTGTQPFGLRADRNWGSGPQRLLIDLLGGPSGTSYTRTILELLNPLPRGVWVDVIINIVWSPTNGRCSAWTRVGDEATFTQRANRTGIPIHYASDSGGYRKGGIYAGQEDIRRVVYHHGYVRRQSFAECAEWYGATAPDPGTPTATPREDSQAIGAPDSGTAFQVSQAGSQRGSRWAYTSPRRFAVGKAWLDGLNPGGTGSQPHWLVAYRESTMELLAVSDEVTIPAGAAAKWWAFPFTGDNLAALDPAPTGDIRIHLLSGPGNTARYAIIPTGGPGLDWSFDSPPPTGPADPFVAGAGGPFAATLAAYLVSSAPSSPALEVASGLSQSTGTAELTESDPGTPVGGTVIGVTRELTAEQDAAVDLLRDAHPDVIIYFPEDYFEVISPEPLVLGRRVVRGAGGWVPAP